MRQERFACGLAETQPRQQLGHSTFWQVGCVGLRCEREEDVVDVINQARAINDCPVVIDFIVGADAQVWPMVAAGTSNDEIQAARGIRPLFDDITEGHA